VQPFPDTESWVAQQRASARASRSSVSLDKAYDTLRTDSQRDAIDRVLEDLRRVERNPYAKWKLVYIKANRQPVLGTFGKAVETKDIRVVFKRFPCSPP
jgi:hypothetical protein